MHHQNHVFSPLVLVLAMLSYPVTADAYRCKMPAPSPWELHVKDKRAVIALFENRNYEMTLVDADGVEGLKVGQVYSFQFARCRASGETSSFRALMAKRFIILKFHPPSNVNTPPPPEPKATGLGSAMGGNTPPPLTNFIAQRIVLTPHNCCPGHIVESYTTLDEAKAELAAFRGRMRQLETSETPEADTPNQAPRMRPNSKPDSASPSPTIPEQTTQGSPESAPGDDHGDHDPSR